MTRIRVALAAIALLCLVAASAVTTSTRAAWTDQEHADASLTAGTVAPPTGLDCTGSLLGGRITMDWTAPSGGVARTGYAWEITGVASGSGALPADATSLTQTIPLLTVGTGTFTLRATGPGGWTSTPVSTTFLIVTGGIITC